MIKKTTNHSNGILCHGPSISSRGNRRVSNLWSPSFFRLIYRPPFRIQPLGLIFNVFRFLRRLGFSRSGSMCLVGLEGSVVPLSFSSLSLGICMGTGQSCSSSSYSHLPAYRWSWEVLELWRACLRSINLLLKKKYEVTLWWLWPLYFSVVFLSVLSISAL